MSSTGKNETAKQTTICLLRTPGKILLAMKKRGFGVGKWNGAGGKLEPGETALHAALRETEEEIGVTPTEVVQAAIFSFYFLNTESGEYDLHTRTHVYFVDAWTGTPLESEEMAPRWFPIGEIPYSEMWESDTVWLPALLEGRSVEGSFYYDSTDKLIRHELRDRQFIDPIRVCGTILELLDAADVSHRLFEHRPALTYQDLENVQRECGFVGTESKCLVLKSDHGFLVYDTLQGTRIDMKAMKRTIGARSLRLATAAELDEHFGAEPGCAYPFGFADTVPILVDKQIFEQEWVLFSPARSDRTVQAKGSDLRRVFETVGNQVSLI